jgi:hypothetical protein
MYWDRTYPIFSHQTLIYQKPDRFPQARWRAGFYTPHATSTGRFSVKPVRFEVQSTDLENPAKFLKNQITPKNL